MFEWEAGQQSGGVGDWEVRPGPLRPVPPRFGPLAAESGRLARSALRLYSGFRIVAKNKGRNGELQKWQNGKNGKNGKMAKWQKLVPF